MSKFFIGFLIIFALVGVVYRLNIDLNQQVPVTMVTYVDDELGFTLTHMENAPISIGEPVIVPTGSSSVDVMASVTSLDPSGLNIKATDFVKEITQNTTVYYVQTGQFEGRVSYEGFFFKNNFIIPIRYVWDGVDWTNPEYDSTKDPKFNEFLNILRSIEFIHVEQGIYEGLNQNM